MKIDKEKFNQLKQLDRIEFRQRYRNINEGGFSSHLQFPMWTAMILASIFGTVGLVSGRIDFLKVSVFFLNLAGITIVLYIIFSISIFIFQRIRTKELEEEYFSVEVKK